MTSLNDINREVSTILLCPVPLVVILTLCLVLFLLDFVNALKIEFVMHWHLVLPIVLAACCYMLVVTMLIGVHWKIVEQQEGVLKLTEKMGEKEYKRMVKDETTRANKKLKGNKEWQEWRTKKMNEKEQATVIYESVSSEDSHSDEELNILDNCKNMLDEDEPNINDIVLESSSTIILMEYQGKPAKDRQQSYLKEILAEFDIETHVNKVAVRCFESLLSSHKQAFEYIGESEKKLIDFEGRLSKTECFSGQIETMVNTRAALVDALSLKLETFNCEFAVGMQEMNNNMIVLRKDYDSLLSNTYKNTNQIRDQDVIVNNLERNSKELRGIFEDEIKKMWEKSGKDYAKIVGEVNEMRKNNEDMQLRLAKAKAELDAKGETMTMLAKDVVLYELDKESIENRFNDIIMELESKVLRTEMAEMRIQIDGMFMSEKMKVEQGLNSIIKKHESMMMEMEKRFEDAEREIRDNRLKIQEFVSETRIKQIEHKDWLQHLEKLFEESIGQIKNDETIRFQEIHRIVQTNKQEANRMLMDMQSMVEANQKSHGEILVELTINSDQLAEVQSNIDSINDSLSKLSTKGGREWTRRPSEGEPIPIINGELFVSVKHDIDKCLEQIREMKTNQREFKESISKEQKILTGNIEREMSQNMIKLTEMRRSIDKISIEIMNTLNKSEKEAKKYTDSMRIELNDKFERSDELNSELERLKQEFQKQIVEIEYVNRSISEKMEKNVTIITKFKSDIGIKVETISSEQLRRGVEARQHGKMIEDIKKCMSVSYEIMMIVLSAMLSGEYCHGEGKEQVKLASLVEGWVLEMDEKCVKYRGDVWDVAKVLECALGYFIKVGDRYKEESIENGKEIYLGMMGRELEDAARRKLLRKGTVELPKLLQ